MRAVAISPALTASEKSEVVQAAAPGAVAQSMANAAATAG